MKHLLRGSLAAFILSLTPDAWSADPDASAPFVLTVVASPGDPELKSITIGNDSPKAFSVVLTNISKDPQPVFETSNSWGCWTVSFEFTMPDGRKIHVARGSEIFTRNVPSTILIPPGQRKVYAIGLDKRWESRPELTANDETTNITLKAIYQVEASREAARIKVWTGRVESNPYDLTLERQGTRK
jgi:hypothetical protein